MSRRTPFAVSVCGECTRPVFPARALCPHCSASAWRTAVVPGGRLTNTTTVHRVAGATDRAQVRLGVVLLDSGVRVLARIEGRPRRGGPVRLHVADGAVVARPSKEKES